MERPIKCFTCGTILGDKYEYYTNEVRKRKIERGIDTKTVVYLTSEYKEKTAEGEVLDEIGLTKMCCRGAMLTQIKR